MKLKYFVACFSLGFSLKSVELVGHVATAGVSARVSCMLFFHCMEAQHTR